MRTRLTLTLAILLLAGAASAGESVKGSWWYAVDHITEVAPDARVLLWATLPAQWHGQEVRVTAIEPAPVAVLDDEHGGNKVVEWLLTPDATVVNGQIFCHYEFELVEKPIHLQVDPAQVQPYDRETELYRRYTAPETWIQTEGRVLDQARSIVGAETNPWRQAQLLYHWVLENTTYDAPGPRERDAESVLLARRGDCGHIGVLLTALLRSVGIPARTVTNAWLTGGDHVFTELRLEGYGWVPADASLGQMIDGEYPGFTREDIERMMAGRNVPVGDADWLLGNLFDKRLVCTVGNNLRFDSPTLGHTLVMQRMEPGGRDADPAAVEISGLNRDIVHGGFWVFGDKQPADAEAAHALVHQRLANLFFKVGLFDVVEDVCLQSIQEYTDAVQSWINMGKVYLHKGEYYKAEAAFRKAQTESTDKRDQHLEALIWTHNYLGNCYDLMGQREMALQEYQAVIDLGHNFRGAVDYATKFLAKPFTKERAEKL